jgi:hypothetical protein
MSIGIPPMADGIGVVLTTASVTMRHSPSIFRQTVL